MDIGSLTGSIDIVDSLTGKLTSITANVQKFSVDVDQKTSSAMAAVSSSTEKAAGSVGTLDVAFGSLAARHIERAASAVIAFGKEALLTAAKVETLVSVAHFLGAQQELTTAEIDALTAALRKQGITSAQANDTVIQMSRSNLGLADSLALATVAQNLARSTGQNSSETLGQLIRGTQTLQTETLRNAGVVVQADQEYIKFAVTHNRMVDSLSGIEKQQIILAAVLREGEKVTGIYGVTNENVGGKIQSMARHQEEASRSIGEVFLPALRLGVDGLTSFYDLVGKAPETFAVIGLTITGVSTALIAMKGAQVAGIISTGSLTTGMALLGPAVAVIATAFASWKIGSWVGGVTGLTDVVERLTGRLMGTSSADIEASIAARKYTESAEGHAAAVAAQAKNLADLKTKAQEATAALALKSKADADALDVLKTVQSLVDDKPVKLFAAAFAQLTDSQKDNYVISSKLVTEIDKLVAAHVPLVAGMQETYQKTLRTRQGFTDQGMAILAAKGITLEYIETMKLRGLTDQNIAVILDVTTEAEKKWETQLRFTREFEAESLKTSQQLWNEWAAIIENDLATTAFDKGRLAIQNWLRDQMDALDAWVVKEKQSYPEQTERITNEYENRLKAYKAIEQAKLDQLDKDTQRADNTTKAYYDRQAQEAVNTYSLIKTGLTGASDAAIETARLLADKLTIATNNWTQWSGAGIAANAAVSGAVSSTTTAVNGLNAAITTSASQQVVSVNSVTQSYYAQVDAIMATRQAAAMADIGALQESSTGHRPNDPGTGVNQGSMERGPGVNMANIAPINGVIASITGNIAKFRVPGFSLPGFEEGGPVTSTGPAFVHGGEYIVPKDGALVSGGSSIVVNAQGLFMSVQQLTDAISEAQFRRSGIKMSRS